MGDEVLVVDDDPAILRLTRLVLELEGMQVLTATGGRAALAVIEKVQPRVVVLDLNMPDLSGEKVFEELNQRPERPSVLICSAYDADHVRERLGAEASISKPFDPEELIGEVRRLLQD